MASALNTKINSYAIENGIEFDFAVATPPTQTGTTPESTPAYWSILGRSPVYEPTVGPIGGSGSWKFVSNEANFCRLRNNGGVLNTLCSDGDYSIGFWAKANELRDDVFNNSIVLFTLQPNTTVGFSINITGGTAPLPNTVSLTAAGVTTSTGVTMNTTDWYYFAVTKTGTNLNFYINNVLAQTRTNMQTAGGSVIGWGDNLASSDVCSVNISNWYYASTSVIGPTQIAEIWAVGSPAPVIVNYSASPSTASATFVEPTLKLDDILLATPITATALINHPTIATTIGDHVEITTSFIASIALPTSITISTQANKNIVITETLTASLQLINNVIVSTGSNESFSAPEFVASAQMSEAFVSRPPMKASAMMPNATVVIQVTYSKLVTSLNPVFYYNFDQTTMQNYGSWNITSYAVDATILKDQPSTGDMSLIGSGKSWKFAGQTNALDDIKITPQSAQGYYPKVYNPYAPGTNTNPITDLQKSRSYAIEAWYKPDSPWSGLGIKFGIVDFRHHHAIINLTRTEGVGVEIDSTLPAWSDGVGAGVPGLSRERLYTQYGNYLIPNDWNHVVLNFSPSYDVDAETGELILTANRQNLQLWINGNLALNRNYLMDYAYMDAVDIGDRFALQETYDDDRVFATGYSTPSPYNPNTGDAIGGQRGFWRSHGKPTGNQTMFDEFAIYEEPLTNSQILDHYYFIANQNPNRIVIPTPIIAEATMGNHIAFAQTDRNVAANVMTASIDLVMPVILTSTSTSHFASPLIASALNTNVVVYYGTTISANSVSASAEAKEGFFLSDIYYNYVQANITPYRYVTFDAQNEYLDYGIDNDYSLIPTTIGGTIVNPDLGINGKSVKTAGTSYVTDGVILKESEWNDSWGTGQNSYHSAFWFQRALDDTSTTGLRVLWNLNGYKDNQHVVLYQYQNKIHMQFNNGSGTWVEQDSGTLDLFDYNSHFIVIEFDHTNANNNIVRVYIDAVLKITANLGTYTGTTTNAATADSGPNNELNNRPRLSVGCLITPFVSTALPVVPTNTKLIIDEIYWDKNSITSTAVTNLYNAMPDKTSNISLASPLLCSATIVNPQISTSTTVIANSALSNAIFVMPAIFIQFSNTYSANALVCSAEMREATFNTDLRIVPDIFVASALITEPILLSGYLAVPMYASVSMNNPSEIMGLPLTDLSDYIRYLRIESYTNQILHYQEVK